MDNHYAGINDFDFTIYGLLNERGLAEKYKAEVMSYLEAAKPLTKEIFDSLTPEQRHRFSHGMTVWGTTMGLHLKSGGLAEQHLNEIRRKWDHIARSIAIQHRKAAGWSTGPRNDYLIDPDGNTIIPHGNGQSYGPYTDPRPDGVRTVAEGDYTL